MRLVLTLLILLLGAATGGAVTMTLAHRRENIARARDLTGGDPERGKEAGRALGCVACHVMPGVRGPDSSVGPPLDGFGGRKFVGGSIENTPENLTQFLHDPRSVAPKSAMPNVGATEDQVRDLAAYLYTLR